MFSREALNFTMLSILVLCDDDSKLVGVEPAHAFGLLLHPLGIAVDLCHDRSYVDRVLKARGFPEPSLVIPTIENPHHTGGAREDELFQFSGSIVKLKRKGVELDVVKLGGENAVVIKHGRSRVLITGCGFYAWGLGLVRRLGKFTHVVGGLGTTSVSEYAFKELVATLRAMEPKLIVPLHMPLEVRRELARRFNVMFAGTGTVVRIE